MSVGYQRGKWRVRISVNGRRRLIGSFARKEDAVAAYDSAKVEAAKVRVRKPQVEDLTGRRFGLLTVMALNPVRRRGGSTRWDCRCDCGRMTTIWVGDLKVQKSCGCVRGGPPRSELRGKRFGRLVALEFTIRRFASSYQTYWRCRCDCGVERFVAASNLVKGRTVSCGCYNRTKNITHGLSGTRRRARLAAAGGTHTVEEVRQLWQRQEGLCACCGVDLRTVRYELDHIIPLSRGGGNSIQNLQWLCKACNRSKHAALPEEFARRRATGQVGGGASRYSDGWSGRAGHVGAQID